MRKQLKKSSTGILSFITLALLVSACGSSSKRSLYSVNPPSNQNIVPVLDPFANGSTNNSNSPVVGTVSIASVPTVPTVPVGQTVTLIASGATSYNFQFQSNSIGASFVGSSQGVSYVGVTSSTAGSVTITANSISGAYSSPGSITVTFTGSATSYPGTYSSCSLQGPYALSGYSGSQPQVGGSYYFSVLKQTASYGYPEQLKIINVWTPDSSEIGRYYYAWDKFWLTFNSGGQKMIYVRAQSQSTGAVCDAQLSIYVSGGYVSPTPGPVPGGSCGIIPATGLGYCTLTTTLTYYYDGNSCQSMWQSSSCGAKGPFTSLAACQSAVSAGQCGGQSTRPSTQTVYRMDDFGLVNDNMSTWGSMAHYYTQNPSEAGTYFKNPLPAFSTYTASAGTGCGSQLYKCAYFRSQGDARQFLSLDPNCEGYFRNGSAVNPSVGFVCTSQKSGTVPLYFWYRAASEGRIYSRESYSSTLSGLGYTRSNLPVAYVPVQ